MTRAETWGVFLLVSLTVGCGEEAAVPVEEKPIPPAPPIQADAVPDFGAYMLGELPETSAGTRNPFDDPGGSARAVTPAPTAPAPTLRGVVRSDGRYIALFDRGSGGRGETVRGWTIESIDEDAVTLRRGGRRVRRTL